MAEQKIFDISGIDFGAEGTISSESVPLSGNYRIVTRGAKGNTGNYWRTFKSQGGFGVEVSGIVKLNQYDTLVYIHPKMGELSDSDNMISDGASGGGGGGAIIALITPDGDHVMADGKRIKILMIGAGGQGGHDAVKLNIAEDTNDGKDASTANIGLDKSMIDRLILGANKGAGNKFTKGGQTSWGGFGGGLADDDIGGLGGGANKDENNVSYCYWDESVTQIEANVTGYSSGRVACYYQIPVLNIAVSRTDKSPVPENDDFTFDFSITSTTSDRYYINHRVLIDGDSLYDLDTDITPLYKDRVRISSGRMKGGTNIVRIETKTVVDTEFTFTEFSFTKDKSVNVTIQDLRLEGSYIRAKLVDPQETNVDYQIHFNDRKIFPHAEWWSTGQGETDIEFSLPRTLIKPMTQNKVKILAKNKEGTEMRREISVDVTYVGMLFSDKEGKYYSTNLGEILQYLDFGRLMVGDQSEVQEVTLTNNTGIPMHRTKLWVDQKDLDPMDEKVSLSRTDSPFNPKDTIDFGATHVMEHNESIPFYVRLKTTEDAENGGKFDIWVSSDPN